MFRIKFLLPLLVVVSAVVVGCSQRPTAGTGGGNDRGLEAKVSKLEKELKSLQDEAAKARAEAAQQVADLGKERDELKSLLKTRTGERDLAQSQFDGFRKELKELLGKMDAAVGTPAAPSVTALPMPSLAR